MNWLSEKRRARRAFSLIEVLIAIALLLALVASMYGFFFDMLRSRAGAMEYMQQRMAAAAFIKQLDADLMTCVAGDASLGAGVKGSQTQLLVLGRSVAASLAAQEPDNAKVFGDLQFTEYRFDPERPGIDMRRGPAGGAKGERGEFSRLQGTIHKLRFRYHDGREWRQSFDSAAEGRLPRAVEVSIWFRPTASEREEAMGFAPEGEAGLTEQPATRSGAFDERAYARQSDLRDSDEPRPDRLRVFVIADADAEDAEGTLGDQRQPAPAEEPASRPERGSDE